jgi:hypothetical protein
MSQDAGDLSRRQAIVAFGRSMPDRWNGLLLRVSALSERFGGKTENGATIGESAALAGLPHQRYERWSATVVGALQRTPEISCLVGSFRSGGFVGGRQSGPWQPRKPVRSSRF